MKFFLPTVLLAASLGSGFAASPPTTGRTLTDINVIPTRVLKRAISPKFYETLLISPVRGWVTVRAHLVGTSLVGARVVRSDLGGAYDSLALQRAKEIRIFRHYKVDSQTPATPILVHLMVYKTADGTLALSFANIDEAGGEQVDYFGCARLAVLKDDGSSVEIKGPASLEGKGITVRATGVKNNLEAIKQLERIMTR